MFHAVGIRLQKSGRLIVDRAGGGLGVEVEGIISGETHFHQTLAALHGIETRADKIAVEKNVSRSGVQIDVGKPGLKNLRAAADGLEFEFAGTLGADEGTAGGGHDNVAGHFLEV